jgi:hypothetical protein
VPACWNRRGESRNARPAGTSELGPPEPLFRRTGKRAERLDWRGRRGRHAHVCTTSREPLRESSSRYSRRARGCLWGQAAALVAGHRTTAFSSSGSLVVCSAASGSRSTTARWRPSQYGRLNEQHGRRSNLLHGENPDRGVGLLETSTSMLAEARVAAVACVAPSVRDRSPTTAAATSRGWLLRTSTGSLDDGAEAAALLLAARERANDGADRPVGGAEVLHCRGRRAAVAASVGVTPGVPMQNRGPRRPRLLLSEPTDSSLGASWRA